MPAKISRERKRSGKFRVYTPVGVKGTGMTLRNAKRQARLLNAIDRGWKPTQKRGKHGSK